MPFLVNCPTCSGQVQIPDELAGESVICPRCEARFAAPPVAPSRPVAAPLPPPPRMPEVIPPSERKFCGHCGAMMRRAASACPGCQAPQGTTVTAAMPHTLLAPAVTDTGPSRIACGLIALFLGYFGIHKFMLGYTLEGVVMLLITLIGSSCFGSGFVIMWVVATIEGIIYLARSDEEFRRTYVKNRKTWF